MKSAPELWSLASDVNRMESWMAGLVGAREPIRVEVTDSRPEERLAWQAVGSLASTRIAIELSESGFGTSVKVSASNSLLGASATDASLERLLDELGSPERRPFSAV